METALRLANRRCQPTSEKSHDRTSCTAFAWLWTVLHPHGGALIQNLRCDADLTDEQVQKIIRIGDRYWEMVGKFKEEDMTPDEFADYITAKSEQVEKELRERWS